MMHFLLYLMNPWFSIS